MACGRWDDEYWQGAFRKNKFCGLKHELRVRGRKINFFHVKGEKQLRRWKANFFNFSFPLISLRSTSSLLSLEKEEKIFIILSFYSSRIFFSTTHCAIVVDMKLLSSLLSDIIVIYEKESEREGNKSDRPQTYAFIKLP